MFGIGFFELCIIALFALVCFGPQKLPELMRQVGKFLVQAKRVSNEVKSNFDSAMRDAEAAVAKEESEASRTKSDHQKPTDQ